MKQQGSGRTARVSHVEAHRASQRFRAEAKRRKQALVNEFLQEAGHYAMKGDLANGTGGLECCAPKMSWNGAAQS